MATIVVLGVRRLVVWYDVLAFVSVFQTGAGNVCDTLSAAFGAGGGHVGPAVAERLDVPFIDPGNSSGGRQ